VAEHSYRQTRGRDRQDAAVMKQQRLNNADPNSYCSYASIADPVRKRRHYFSSQTAPNLSASGFQYQALFRVGFVSQAGSVTSFHYVSVG
jgi:hypothetical protein